MKVFTQKSLLVLSLAAALLSGCGSNGVTGDPATTYAQDGEIYTPPVVTQSTGYGAYPLSFKTVGSDPNGGPSSPVVSAPLRSDTKLVIKATVGAATRNEGTPVYTNFTANYSCATLRVTLQMEMGAGNYVDFASVDTGRISVPGTSGCAGSVASENIDFSAYLTPGHGLFKIKVAALTSNFNCVTALQYPTRYPYGYAQTVCVANPMQSIYQYHVVNGKLEVQVNGTSFVN